MVLTAVLKPKSYHWPDEKQLEDKTERNGWKEMKGRSSENHCCNQHNTGTLQSELYFTRMSHVGTGQNPLVLNNQDGLSAVVVFIFLDLVSAVLAAA